MIIQTLGSLLTHDLPGMEIQSTMSPAGSQTRKYCQVPQHARQAAVMLLLYEKNEVWYTAFIKRTQNQKDRHSGQISLPGGRLEVNDESLMNCALRETYEEVGINGRSINVIGQMSQLYVFASDYLVFPFVGYVNNFSNFEKQPSEVEEIIQIPISYLVQSEVVKSKQMDLGKYRNIAVPYYDLYGETLWGATAMMVAEFIYIWKKAYA